MVCGRPPFLGDDPIAIISQHVNIQPVAPTWHNAKCPKPLEALILRLLAKDPKERPASANDVLRALEGMDRLVEREKDRAVEIKSDEQIKAYFKKSKTGPHR